MPSSDYSVTTWGVPTTFDFKTPTGQLTHMRYLDVEDLVEMNILAEIDSLTAIVNTDHIEPVKNAARRPQDRQRPQPTKAEKKAEDDKAFQRIMQDPTKFAMMLYVMDKAVQAAVIQPPLHVSYQGDKDDHEKIPFSARTVDVIYVDSIPFSDRMDIFQKALGKMGDLENFREGQDSDVGTMADVSEDEMPAGGTTGDAE